MRVDQHQIAEARRRHRLSALIGREVKLALRGAEFVGLCPFHQEKTPSFTVRDDKCFYHCFGCGAHGDAIDWRMQRRGESFVEAVTELTVGLVRPVDPQERRRQEAEAKRADEERRREAEAKAAAKRARAHALFFGEGIPEILGTPVDRYLRGRGIDLRILFDPARSGRPTSPAAYGNAIPALRYHPRCWDGQTKRHWPAMLAAIVSLEGRFLAVHQTYLDVRADGSVAKAPIDALVEDGKAKMTLGRYVGGSIQLSRGASGKPLCQAEPGEWPFVSEGIEDGLSGMIAEPARRCLVAVSLSNMGSLVLPAAIEGVIILGQNDAPGKGQGGPLMARAIRNFHGQRKRVDLLEPQGVKDLNAALQSAVGAAA